MLTECPSCSTVFRVTGAILKIGHGQVRCGKCRTQFDALESLIDEEQATAEAVSEIQSDDAIEAHESDVAEEITLEGSRIEISGTYRVPTDLAKASRDQSQAQVIHEHVIIDREAPTSDDGSTDSLRADEDSVIEISSDDGEPVADAANHLLADVDTDSDHSQPRGIWNRKIRKDPVLGDDSVIDAELAALAAPEVIAPPRKRWLFASIALVLLLGIQIVHHHRDVLVRNPTYGGLISNVYRTFGLSLTPNWDLKNYELQQWGVVSDNTARDALRVRASVTNGANFAQPYPVIKLALEDRWGSPVAMREFLPEEYLPSTAIANRMMAPRQRTNAEIVIVDPGVDAVGFQLHACLPRDGITVCSDDTSQKN